MKTARFAQAFGFENLQFEEVPDPSPGPGQAVVRVRACSLNYRDLLVARGSYGRAVKAPLTPLSDGAGEVIAVGPDADPRTVSALEMTYFGALVHAGSGAVTYHQIADRLSYVVGLILGEDQ